jgi:hypothetical protein
MSIDPRLGLLSSALAPQGVVGVCVPDWTDKTTWQIWYDGSAAIQGSTDPKAGPIIAAFDPVAELAAANVPQSVTPRQARLALNAAGLLAQVNTAINAADQATQIAWNYASEIRRTDPLITTLGTTLNLTSAQIDALFQQASLL